MDYTVRNFLPRHDQRKLRLLLVAHMSFFHVTGFLVWRQSELKKCGMYLYPRNLLIVEREDRKERKGLLHSTLLRRGSTERPASCNDSCPV